jgi:putative ubiquitin-RnfH superfamily antitoxin RatB of RatAB toxin-antitoxin module
VIRVEVAYALREEQVLVALEMEEGTTVAQAIGQSGIPERFPEVDPLRSPVGIFGRRVRPDTLLHDGDRVEIYRPLAMDPHEARRRRAALHRKDP